MLPVNARVKRSPRKPYAAYELHKDLSGGAIARIVIGVLHGLAMISVIWWSLKKRREAARQEGVENGNAEEKRIDTFEGEELKSVQSGTSTQVGSGQSESVQSPDTVVSELSPDWRLPELSAGKDVAKFEMAGEREKGELPGDLKKCGHAVELEGDVPKEEEGMESVGKL